MKERMSTTDMRKYANLPQLDFGQKVRDQDMYILQQLATIIAQMYQKWQKKSKIAAGPLKFAADAIRASAPFLMYEYPPGPVRHNINTSCNLYSTHLERRRMKFLSCSLEPPERSILNNFLKSSTAFVQSHLNSSL